MDYVAEIKIFSSREAIPTNYAECAGQLLLRVDYPDLFAKIGVTYGSTSGGNFRLPNLRRTFPAGADDPETPESEMSLGGEGGEESHTLTVDEMPAHTHTSRVQTASGNGGNQYIQAARTLQSALQTGSTGGDSPHENRPPFLALVFAICLYGTLLS